MTEREPENGTAFQSLHRDYTVHVPVFEAFVGPPPQPPVTDRSPDGFLVAADAIRQEQERLKGLVQRAGESGDPTYVPLAGPIAGTRTERANDVRSITFTESVGSEGELAKVELELHNVYDPVSQRYRYSDPPLGEDTPVIDYGKMIALRVGYRDKVDFVFEGPITEYRVSFPGEGASMVSVTAVDRRDALKSFTPDPSPSARHESEEEALKDIAGRAGFKVALRSADQRTPAAGGVRLPPDHDVGGYVSERAQRTALELSCFGETLFVMKPGDDADTALVYRYRDGLISFTPTFNANGQRTRVVVRFRRPDGTRAEVAATADDLRREGLTPSDGEIALVQIADRSVTARDRRVTDVNVETRAEATALAVALLKRSLDQLFTAEGELLGDPRVRAGTSLRIEGVGRFNGVYYVTKTIHEYGENGYRTRFTVRRNTRPGSEPAPAAGASA